MAWQWTVFTLPLVLAFIALSLVATYLFTRWLRNEGGPGSNLATGLVACIAITLGCYILEVSTVSLETKVLFNQLQYLGLAPLTAFLLSYVFVYIGRGTVLTTRTYALLFLPPALTLVSVATYDLHWTFWTTVTLDTSGPYVMLVNEHGVAYVGFFAYTAAYSMTSIGLLIRKGIDAPGVHRWQIVAMIVGILTPLAGGFVYVLGVVPRHYPTPTYLAFVVTAIAFSWPVFRLRLFGIVPIAHRTLLDQMDDGVVACDENWTIVTANAGAATLLGSTPAAMVGSPVETALEPIFEDDRDPIVILTDDETWTVTVTDRIVEVSVTELTQTGHPIGQLIRLSDITERHTRAQQLQRQNTSLDEFAAVVSHDIATPLSVISSRARLIQSTGDPDHVEDVVESADRIRQLMDELLELARQGRAVDGTEPVDLETEVRTAWEGLDTGGSTLDVHSSTRVRASRNRCRQLFENLLKNAVIHGAPPRSVAVDGAEISGRQTAQGPDSGSCTGVTIRVGMLPGGFYLEDDGVGIPEADRTKVLEQGVTSTPDGTGLGLAIVSRIVDAHGWSIEVTEGVEGGARFEVTGVEIVPDGIDSGTASE